MTHDATTAQLSLTMDELYNNQFLFSDHYLDALLPGDPRWEAAREEAAAFRAWLRDLYAREGEYLDDYSENQLEEHWFKPIFERLGHVFETQARVPGLGKGIRRPDYAFFPTEENRQEAAAIQKTEAYAQRALAVGEVKQWDIHLSKKQRSGDTSFERQNPSYQIDYYLKATGLTWGILANGRTWRLVHRETSYRLDTYYEVDLLDLLEQDDPAAIRYFYLFFRQAAFRPDDQGRVFLDDVLAGSEAYALTLEEDLQENAYRALELLMQGFLDYAPNELSADDLREIYDNSLYLLYRLLFILYGESRGLLPVRNPRYREFYSFALLKKEIAALQDSGVYIGRRSSKHYDALTSLFHLINGDDPEFNAEIEVVRYNGGLFDPQQHPFLAEKSVGDQAFTQAIDLLCRRETESGSKEFVDYRTLNVRHLGSIYEGLLEYQPRLAAERMVAIRDGKGEQWLPASGHGGTPTRTVVERRAEGEIYLETDKGERKATGSYYTPQYIVAYIVAQTLGPLVDGILDEIKAAAVPESEAGRAFVARVLALKVLDPSMGSGHFLVEATDYLARALTTDPYVEVEEAAESDLNHWRRRVVERCIYGVDKNPLAVELAKLSLWLNTFAGDKPLGFLDHHLKCGDSLVGAQIADLEEQPEVLLSKKEQRQREKEAAAGAQQLGLGLFAGEFNRRLPEMLRELFAIMEAESVDYEAVRAKEAANARVERLKAPFQAVADLYTSAHFGNTYSESEYKAA
ncbi:MAG: N-6 DNA methylase, partial [Chloroflexi bacterium]|nr:N-6 DNA methylase [Chloroflexota bacterium]